MTDPSTGPDSSSPYIDAEAAVHRTIEDGAAIVDASQTVLALFVTREGQVNVRSVYDGPTLAGLLRQIADKAESRGPASPTTQETP